MDDQIERNLWERNYNERNFSFGNHYDLFNPSYSFSESNGSKMTTSNQSARNIEYWPNGIRRDSGQFLQYIHRTKRKRYKRFRMVSMNDPQIGDTSVCELHSGRFQFFRLRPLVCAGTVGIMDNDCSEVCDSRLLANLCNAPTATKIKIKHMMKK